MRAAAMALAHLQFVLQTSNMMMAMLQQQHAMFLFCKDLFWRMFFFFLSALSFQQMHHVGDNKYNCTVTEMIDMYRYRSSKMQVMNNQNDRSIYIDVDLAKCR